MVKIKLNNILYLTLLFFIEYFGPEVSNFISSYVSRYFCVLFLRASDKVKKSTWKF